MNPTNQTESLLAKGDNVYGIVRLPPTFTTSQKQSSCQTKFCASRRDNLRLSQVHLAPVQGRKPLERLSRGNQYALQIGEKMLLVQ